MGDLPKERVEGYQVFDVTGIDFCGPFFYKSEVRNKAPIKCYISVFICFTTKAVHLELVRDRSTAAFLLALRRFIFIRKKPRQIWSDNATNFVGAKNQLSELKRLFLGDEHQRAVLDFCLPESIEWKFIPPRSPHFGGLWEAAVSAKYHFYRVVGSAVLKADDLQTLVYNIAAGLVFLQQCFWSRWKEEYLTLLQQRSKWRIPGQGIAVNDILLVKDENLPPIKWPLARVSEMVVGDDGVCRVALLSYGDGQSTNCSGRDNSPREPNRVNKLDAEEF
ncbi:uncharacterized protein LOC123257061 [Drosophila ananassae]|uniref:uncharacterized protein LOC123257061 n=1 Tax=Drosophila ananassae TaxID=7217 RepID=UPI001CFFCEE5|nr:uncharacterized protein LOC123257061 [Drosophila ananassae]